MSGQVSFNLTDTQGEENPVYNLAVNLEGFDSPDSLLARLNQIREIIEVRYQRKFQIAIAIENDEEAMPRLEALKQMIDHGGGSSPDICDLHYQVEAAISAIAEPDELDRQKQSSRSYDALGVNPEARLEEWARNHLGIDKALSGAIAVDILEVLQARPYTDHPLANPEDEPSRFPHVNQDDPNKPGAGDQF